MSSTYDEDLIEEISTEIRNGLIKVFQSSDEYFFRLETEFPTKGARIDWSKVPSAYTAVCPNQVGQLNVFIETFKKVAFDNGLNGNVICIGDSVTEIALGMSVSVLCDRLNEILSISVPSH